MNMHHPKISLKLSILAPLMLSLTALIAAFAYSFSRLEEAFTKDFVDGAFTSAQKAYAASIATDTEKISVALGLILQDEPLRRAMLANDRAALLQRAGPMFERLRRESGITHFYFHAPDRRNLLRVHQPERFGDKIERHTARQAESTGQPAAGLELGPLGTFTLRVVFPWRVGNRLIGYVELGEEIEHLLDRTRAMTGVDLYVGIDKKHLSKNNWRAGVAMLGRQTDWDLLRDRVVTYQPDRPLSVAMRELLGQGKSDPMQMVRVVDQDQIMQARAMPLSDVAGREVGQLLLVRDITRLVDNNRHQTWLVGGLGLVIAGALMGLFMFITGRVEKRLQSSQKSLSDSEQRYRALVESINDWIWEIDAEGRYVYASPKVRDILGYAPDEILGKTPFDLMPPDEAEHLAREFRAIVAARRAFAGLENRNLSKDGRVVILETSGMPILREGGNLAGYRGVDRDITDRKRASDALRKAMQRLDLHFKQTPLAVIEWDNDFRVLNWNPSAEYIFGYTREEALGRHAMELIVPEGAGAHVATIWENLLRSSGGQRSTNENITKAGDTIICEWYNTSLVDEHGQLIGVTSLAQDITEQKLAEQRLNHLAYHDDLTGLPNRALFHDRLTQAMAVSGRHNELAGIMIMDLDRFKDINDTLGHAVGNKLLQAVASRLKHSLRESDTVARLGGDEFAIALIDAEVAEDIAQIARKLIDTFAQPFLIDDHELYVTCSIGITLYPVDDKNIPSLLRNADSAMYLAKESGRNCFRFYSAALTARAERRLAMETELRHALERGEFQLHYQPQIEIATGRVAGLEALLRWRHPEKGTVPPSEFIPIAEDSGIIVPLGEWVLRTAFLQAKAWRDQGLPETCIAINLSARQFRQGQVVPLTMKLLDETGLPPRCIEFEITESLFIEEGNSEIATMLNGLRALGISLSIDDFGTGYSSLSYLKRFPIDKLKIDQSFVRGITTAPEDASLVKAIIAMAHSLNLKTIAEGAETESQYQFLRRHHCDVVQGFFCSHPLPVEEATALMRAGGVLAPPPSAT